MNSLFGELFRDFGSDFWQNFGHIFDQVFDQVFDQGFCSPPQIRCTVLPGQKIQCTVLPGYRKRTVYYIGIPKNQNSILDTLQFYSKIPLNSLFNYQVVNTYSFGRGIRCSGQKCANIKARRETIGNRT